MYPPQANARSDLKPPQGGHMSPAYLCRQIRAPDSVLPIAKSLWRH